MPTLAHVKGQSGVASLLQLPIELGEEERGREGERKLLYLHQRTTLEKAVKIFHLLTHEAVEEAICMPGKISELKAANGSN